MPSEFYPSGIRERRDIRERQIQRMQATRLPRPETLGPVSISSDMTDSPAAGNDQEMVRLEEGVNDSAFSSSGKPQDSSYGPGQTSTNDDGPLPGGVASGNAVDRTIDQIRSSAGLSSSSSGADMPRTYDSNSIALDTYIFDFVTQVDHGSRRFEFSVH